MSKLLNTFKTTIRESIIIMTKDLKSYFFSPIAYIVIALFLIITGALFFPTFFIYNRAELRGFFQILPLVFALIIPAITMKLFAEERNTGAFETLLTMPVTTGDIVAGKILASTIFVIVMLIPTLMYPATISFVGELEIGPIVGGYLGAILLGSAYCAVGVFASSLTKNQIVAFIIAFVICILLSLIDKFLVFFPATVIDYIEVIGADYHFRNISKGVFDTRNIIYFLSIIAVCWFGTVKIIDERR